MNRTYEVIFILRPDLADEECDTLVAALEAAAASSGAGVRKVDRLGRRRLAYRVRGFREGHYVLFDLETQAPEAIAELQRRLRISEPVIKYLAVRPDELEKRADKRRRHRAARLARRPPRPEAAKPAEPEADDHAVLEGRGEGDEAAPAF